MTAEPSDATRIVAILAAAGDVGYEWDLITDAVTWVGDTAALFGAGRHRVASGDGLNGRINAEDLPSRLKALDRHYRSHEPYDLEYRVRRFEGSFCWVHDRGQAEFSPDGKPLLLRGILRRIDRRKAYETRLELSANFDDLTGQFNRARLRDALQQSIAHAMRYSGTGGFLLIDIDRLGEVNDAYGYATADAAIVAVAQRIERAVGASDTVGRIGGDVFGVALDQCGEQELEALANALVTQFRAEPLRTSLGPVQVTVSIGGVSYPEYVKTPAEAMSKAEAALAEAKRLGQDRFVHYRMSKAEQADHRRILKVGESVKTALKRDALALAYQPVVDAGTAGVRFHECLLRIVRPDGVLASAGEFIPVAERLGMARLIDRRVLEMVVEELGSAPGVTLAMNISGITATDRSWLRTLVALLRDAPDVARRLVVEITETAAIQDIEETTRFVASARELGCRIALDDFGAGYISFRHLKSLAVDIVKIDGSFVRGLPARPDNLVFIRSLISLAQSFGLDTIAECVEDAADAALLRREGITMLQGWHFGRPSVRRPWLPVSLVEPAE